MLLYDFMIVAYTLSKPITSFAVSDRARLPAPNSAGVIRKEHDRKQINIAKLGV